MWGHRVLQGNRQWDKTCCVGAAEWGAQWGRAWGQGHCWGCAVGQSSVMVSVSATGRGRPGGPAPCSPLPHPCPSVLLQLPGRALVQLRRQHGGGGAGGRGEHPQRLHPLLPAPQRHPCLVGQQCCQRQQQLSPIEPLGGPAGGHEAAQRRIPSCSSPPIPTLQSGP